MAKPRLKVFRTQMGFVDAIVAAPSQAAALKGWGVKQNLFAEKMAQVTDEPNAVKAALAAPGVVLQRPVGSKAAFSDAAEPSQRCGQRVRSQAEAPSPPDRAALDAARAASAKIDADEKRKMAQIDKARSWLDAEERDLKGRAEESRREAEQAVTKAERDFVRRGGRLSHR